MKKYIAIISGVATIVFAALVLQPDAYGYARKRKAYTMPSECAGSMAALVQSIWADADLTKIEKLYCVRSFDDEEHPNQARCSGRQVQTIDTPTWWSKVQVDGMGRWHPMSVDTEAHTVQVARRWKAVKLDAIQLYNLGNVFKANCLLDINNSPITWENTLDFTMRHKDSVYTLSLNYITSSTNLDDIATEAKDGQVLWAVTSTGE